jgi:hypothetical protein
LPPPPTPTPPAPQAPSVAPGSLPTREELTIAWGDSILAGLRPGVKVYLSSGRFTGVDEAGAVYAVPDKGLLTRAATNRTEVEAALAAYFGRPIPVRLVLDDAAGSASILTSSPAAAPEDPAAIDLDDLIDAPGGVLSPEQRLLKAFPGAEEVSP